MLLVFSKQELQMPFAEHDEMVKAVILSIFHKPLREGIQIERP